MKYVENKAITRIKLIQSPLLQTEIPPANKHKPDLYKQNSSQEERKEKQNLPN
jgi:hypothetical protein